MAKVAELPYHAPPTIRATFLNGRDAEPPLLTTGSSGFETILQRVKAGCHKVRVRGAHTNPTSGSWPNGTEAAGEGRTSQVRSRITCIRILRNSPVEPSEFELSSTANSLTALLTWWCQQWCQKVSSATAIIRLIAPSASTNATRWKKATRPPRALQVRV